MSQESLNQPSELASTSVVLRLHATSQDTIQRVLVDKTTVKLGRQVKSAEDRQPELEKENPIAVFQAEKLNVEQKADPNEPIYFKSKVVSRVHAEIWLKDGQVYLKDVGSSSGTFLNKMRLSPANKRSRPYPLRQGDLIQLGVDYQGRTEEIYKAVELRVEITIDDHQIREQQQQIPLRFRKALNQLLVATNPYASMDNHEHEHDKSQDCCICLAEIGPFQALFIAPCSHCFHYKCIKSVLRDCLMFPCPVCRQVANLDASVSMESLFDYKRRSELDLKDMDLDNNDTVRANQFGLEHYQPDEDEI